MTQREEKLDAHICLMQLAMQEYLVPDGSLDADAFINRMIELLDGPEQREAQAAQPPSTTEWTLIAPDGTLFTGPSPFKTAVKATSHHVKTDPVAAKRFEDAIEEIRKEGEAENDRCMREYGTLDCPACGGSGHIGELEAQLNKWETTLTAVMPADFKDWHQNSKAEWPEVAALVITNLRKHIDDDAAYVARLEAQVAALNNALNGFIANSCRVDWPADIYDAAMEAQKGTP